MPFKAIAIVFMLISSQTAHAGALERLFAPAADLWPFWDNAGSLVTPTINHTNWDRFLQAHVQQHADGINRVAYATIDTNAHQSLQDYINQLQQISIRQYSRDEQLIYWINLYNAVTIDVVLQHYPVESIRQINISPGFFAEGPWGKKLMTIEGQAVSLNDIEHRILRPIWKDPRLHYALNCASIGCPNLSNRAYTVNNIDRALDEAASDYINHRRGVTTNADELIVSSIYSWFQEDFGSDDAAVIAHLQKYAASQLAKKLQRFNTISDDEYNWQLNDALPIKHDNKEDF